LADWWGDGARAGPANSQAVAVRVAIADHVDLVYALLEPRCE